MKVARITSIPKVAKPESPCDHQPFSVTAVIVSFLELMITRKFWIPTYNKWMPRNQHGFRTSASSTTALTEFVRDNAEFVRLLSIDLSKAFDSRQSAILYNSWAYY